MTAGQYIDYEALQQEAQRGVVRAVLVMVAETGLVGIHAQRISAIFAGQIRDIDRGALTPGKSSQENGKKESAVHSYASRQKIY